MKNDTIRSILLEGFLSFHSLVFKKIKREISDEEFSRELSLLLDRQEEKISSYDEAFMRQHMEEVL